jgi:predicted metalloprotease with PDZ domain
MHTLPLALFPLLLLSPPPASDGWLGIYLDGEAEAAVVLEVIPDSPAHKAGLEAGDVLLAVGDTATPDQDAFVGAIQKGKAGDRVAIKLRRAGREQTVVVTLGKRGEEQVPAPSSAPPASTRGERPAPASESKPAGESKPAAESKPANGLPTAPASASEPGYLGVSVREVGGGVVVDRVLPDGPAHEVLRAGDRLSKLGSARVESLADLDRALAGKAAGSELQLEIERAGAPTKLSLALGKRPAKAGGAAAAKEPAVAMAAPVAPTKQRSGSEPATDKTAATKGEQQRRNGVPMPPAAPVAPSSGEATQEAFAAELEALRAELAELRRQLEELRQRRNGK